jgi:hypothetical protein
VALTFVAENAPSAELCSELELLDPTIPYNTAAYCRAMEQCHREVWLFGAKGEKGLRYGCVGEVESGRLRRQLNIQSTPSEASEVFWAGLLSFCRDRGVTLLRLGTVGTSPVIPEFARVVERKVRMEYWVDLLADDLRMNLRPEQRRICNRASERGFTIESPSPAEGLQAHQRLTDASLGRRRARGEDIPIFDDSPVPRALLECGVSRIYECRLGDRVLGSVIFSVARGGAHGYSAGFSNEAMKLGVGAYLNLMTFQIMKAEGRKVFNLGDAPDNSGLATFKRGLGGIPHGSIAITFDVSSEPRRSILRIDTLIRAAGRSVRNLTHKS